MIRVLESLENKEGKLVIDVRDSEGQLKELVNYIKDVASAGHTFDVVVDPGNENWEKAFEIDGDGAFRINEVEFEKDDDDDDDDEIEIKEESVKKESFETFTMPENIIDVLDITQKCMNYLSKIWNENEEYLDNGDYPFDKSFDEITTDFDIWVRQCKSIYLDGDEK